MPPSPTQSVPLTGPVTDELGVVFSLGDPYRRLSAVRLQDEVGLGGLEFERDGTQWFLRVPRPPVARMEYLFEVEDRNGHRTTATDPANPLRAPGAFGDKSVLEFADYTAPSWLSAGGAPGALVELSAGGVAGAVWTPDGLELDERAPLLIVHDGPEFAELGRFVHFVAAGVDSGSLPPTRVALLGPGDRNDWYSASRSYASAVACDVLPALPPATVRIGVGVSLGALAMLHLHWAHAELDGLFLQSGSFFTPELDGQKSGFSGYGAVTEFVCAVHDTQAAHRPVPTALTCGVVEENLANNQRMTASLERIGYDAALHVVADAHNYTAWRDALHPHLTELIRTVVAGSAS